MSEMYGLEWIEIPKSTNTVKWLLDGYIKLLQAVRSVKVGLLSADLVVYLNLYMSHKQIFMSMKKT